MNNNPALYISSKDLGLLLDVSKRHVIRQCKTGNFKTQKESVQGGKSYTIYIPSLPLELQLKWVQENMLLALTLDDESRKLLEPAAQVEIIRRSTNHVSIGLETLADKNKIEKFGTKLQIIKAYSERPFGIKKSDWVEQLAKKYNTSRATIYRYIKQEDQGNQEALLEKKKNKCHTSWDKKAIEYMKAFYLSNLKSLGEINKSAVYNEVKNKAEKEGWTIGSMSSAYYILKDLNHLHEMLARGGRRAIDNFFYIKRTYTDLNPFEINRTLKDPIS